MGASTRGYLPSQSPPPAPPISAKQTHVDPSTRPYHERLPQSSHHHASSFGARKRKRPEVHSLDESPSSAADAHQNIGPASQEDNSMCDSDSDVQILGVTVPSQQPARRKKRRRVIVKRIIRRITRPRVTSSNSSPIVIDDDDEMDQVNVDSLRNTSVNSSSSSQLFDVVKEEIIKEEEQISSDGEDFSEEEQEANPETRIKSEEGVVVKEEVLKEEEYEDDDTQEDSTESTRASNSRLNTATLSIKPEPDQVQVGCHTSGDSHAHPQSQMDSASNNASGHQSQRRIRRKRSLFATVKPEPVSTTAHGEEDEEEASSPQFSSRRRIMRRRRNSSPPHDDEEDLFGDIFFGDGSCDDEMSDHFSSEMAASEVYFSIRNQNASVTEQPEAEDEEESEESSEEEEQPPKKSVTTLGHLDYSAEEFNERYDIFDRIPSPGGKYSTFDEISEAEDVSLWNHFSQQQKMDFMSTQVTSMDTKILSEYDSSLYDVASLQSGSHYHNNIRYGHFAEHYLNTFRSRKECKELRLHNNHMAGIDTCKKNCCSGAIACSSGGGYDDTDDSFADTGDVLFYIGAGGGPKYNNNLASGVAFQNQSVTKTGGTHCLFLSFINRVPVRVIRSSKFRSLYRPDSDYRYDGLYMITGVIRELRTYEADSLKNHTKKKVVGDAIVYRFRLVRVDRSQPLPRQLSVQKPSGRRARSSFLKGMYTKSQRAVHYNKRKRDILKKKEEEDEENDEE